MLFPSRRGWIVRFRIAAALSLILPALGLLGRWNWICDAVSHFQLQYALVLAVVVIAGLFLRRWILSTVLAVAATVLIWPFLASFRRVEPAESSSPTLHIVSFNVHTANRRKQETIDYLESLSADLVVLQEVDIAWTEALKPLLATYPYVIRMPRRDNFGIALLSKVDIRDVEIHDFGDYYLPWITATVPLEGTDLKVAAVHPVPPMGAERWTMRNHHLEEVGAWITQSGKRHGIVMGDLNTTVYSPWTRRFLETTGLRDSANGFGLLPTWMTRMPPLAIPLDQVLVGPGITVLERKVGPDLGSDHRPVEARIRAD